MNPSPEQSLPGSTPSEKIVLTVSLIDGVHIKVSCVPSAFENSYATGIAMAMAGKVVLRAMCADIQANPNLIEQAEAEMLKGFTDDLSKDHQPITLFKAGEEPKFPPTTD